MDEIRELRLDGLTLEEALRRLGPDGASWRIRETGDSRHPRTDGTLRVIRVRPGELTVARFHDRVAGTEALP